MAAILDFCYDILHITYFVDISQGTPPYVHRKQYTAITWRMSMNVSNHTLLLLDFAEVCTLVSTFQF